MIGRARIKEIIGLMPEVVVDPECGDMDILQVSASNGAVRRVATLDVEEMDAMSGGGISVAGGGRLIDYAALTSSLVDTITQIIKGMRDELGDEWSISFRVRTPVGMTEWTRA